MKAKIEIVLIILFVVLSVCFTKYDYFLYDDTIATITNIEENFVESKTLRNSNHQYSEDYFMQDITLEIKNTQNIGKIVSAQNKYAQSQVYDCKYSVGDDVFLSSLRADNGKLSANIANTKRDYFVVLTIAILLSIFILLGGKEGILTTVSLIINLIFFYIVLLLYLKGYNILYLSIIMVIVFTAMLLFFMYGWNKESKISLLCCLLSLFVTILLASIVIKLNKIDYDFMEYLPLPYDKNDAYLIFLSELLIGALGAIMDIVTTIVMTAKEITVHNKTIEFKSLYKVCTNVGSDVVSAMINVMLFTNVAAAIPFFVLSMRNGISFMMIIKYNIFFELARFLVGSIGIVLTIPISAYFATYFYGRRRKKC